MTAEDIPCIPSLSWIRSNESDTNKEFPVDGEILPSVISNESTKVGRVTQRTHTRIQIEASATRYFSLRPQITLSAPGNVLGLTSLRKFKALESDPS